MSAQTDRWADMINIKLDELSRESDAPALITEAIRYSLLSGGKRLRGILTLAANACLGGDQEEVLVYACAVEMIHCFSLIHDDLPSMDDDDTRRGKPSSHIVYGEAMALLAGDALLSLAFECMLAHALRYPDRLVIHVEAIEQIAAATGSRGMAGGQCLDLSGVDSYSPDPAIRLKELHSLKTGALFKAAVASGLILANATREQIGAGIRFASSLGMAFQIRDDILDVIGDPAIMGKRAGMDADKVTWVTLYGLKGSERACAAYLDEAECALDALGGDTSEMLRLVELQRQRNA